MDSLKKLFLLISMASVFHFSCQKNEMPELIPVAKFSTPIIDLGKVTFRNYSLNATEFHWDFGNGVTSTEFEPCYEYEDIGVYNVVLTASDGVNSNFYNQVIAIGQIFPDNLFELDTPPFLGGAEMIQFTYGDKAYVGGGYQNLDFSSSKNIWEFDLSSEEWEQLSTIPYGSFTSGINFVLDDIAHFGLGNDNNQNDYYNIYNYSISDDDYSYASNLPFDLFTDGAVFDVVSFSHNNKGYIIGSNNVNSPNPNKFFFEFDPTNNSWTDIGEYPGAGGFGMFHFMIDNKLYIGLGNSNPYSNFLNDSDFWEYDFDTQVWTQKNNFPNESRRDGINFTYNGNGYIGFGYARNLNTGTFKGFSDIWKYDHVNDTWELIANMPVPCKHELFYFIKNNNLYFGGGFNTANGMEDKFYRYEID